MNLILALIKALKAHHPAAPIRHWPPARPTSPRVRPASSKSHLGSSPLSEDRGLADPWLPGEARKGFGRPCRREDPQEAPTDSIFCASALVGNLRNRGPICQEAEQRCLFYRRSSSD